MKYIWHWISSWFVTAGVARSVLALHRKCDALDRERRRVEAHLEREGERAASANSRLQSALATAQQTINSYEKTVATLRAEKEVQSMEIKLMERGHAKFMERYRAETAIEIARYTVPKDENFR